MGPVKSAVFGRAQYVWQPLKKIADPDGPAVRSELHVNPATLFELPAASITVLRGKLENPLNRRDDTCYGCVGLGAAHSPDRSPTAGKWECLWEAGRA